MGDPTRGPLRLVVIRPCVHGIGVAWLQEPGGGHAMGGLAVGDLQEGGASLADLGTRVVVAQPKEFLALLFGQGEGSPDQGWLPCLHVRIVHRDDYDEFTDFDSQKPLDQLLRWKRRASYFKAGEVVSSAMSLEQRWMLVLLAQGYMPCLVSPTCPP
jgi:hypothetical protein